jgi:hypothetical protein
VFDVGYKRKKKFSFSTIRRTELSLTEMGKSGRGAGFRENITLVLSCEV